MCATDWYRVPRELRDRVWTTCWRVTLAVGAVTGSDPPPGAGTLTVVLGRGERPSETRPGRLSPTPTLVPTTCAPPSPRRHRRQGAAAADPEFIKVGKGAS